MKKILLCTTHGSIGGVQTHILELCKFIKENYDYQVDIAVGPGVGETNLISLYEENCDSLFIISNFKREISPINDIKAYRELKKVIKDNNYDLVHVHGPKASGITRLICKQLKVKNIRSMHLLLYMEYKGWKRFLVKSIEKLASRWTDLILTVSEFNKRNLIEDKIAPEQKVVSVYNGISITNEPDIIRKLEYKKFVICCAMRLDKPKDPFTLMYAINLLKEKGYKFHVYILGDGSLKENMIQYTNENNLSEFVSFEGRVIDVDYYLNKSNLFILPTHFEGLPISIIEAMRAGLPIISNPVAGVPEQVINEYNGYLFPIGDYNLLAEYIETLINDKGKLKDFSFNSYDLFVERFEIGKNYSEIVNCYERVINAYH